MWPLGKAHTWQYGDVLTLSLCCRGGDRSKSYGDTRSSTRRTDESSGTKGPKIDQWNGPPADGDSKTEEREDHQSSYRGEQREGMGRVMKEK